MVIATLKTIPVSDEKISRATLLLGNKVRRLGRWGCMLYSRVFPSAALVYQQQKLLRKKRDFPSEGHECDKPVPACKRWRGYGAPPWGRWRLLWPWRQGWLCISPVGPHKHTHGVFQVTKMPTQHTWISLSFVQKHTNAIKEPRIVWFNFFKILSVHLAIQKNQTPDEEKIVFTEICDCESSLRRNAFTGSAAAKEWGSTWNQRTMRLS